MTLSRHQQTGLSLVELMVAIAIGIFLTGAVATIFVITNRAFSDTTRLSHMGDNGRFAAAIMGKELKNAYFLGNTNPGLITPDADLFPVNGDCSGTAAAYAFTPSNSAISIGTTDANGDAFSCITDGMPGTGVLIIKNVRPEPLPMIGVGSTYILSNEQRAIVFNSADATPPNNTTDVPGGVFWHYNFQAFYVRNANGTPTLSRRILRTNAGETTLTTEDLAEGIEDIQVDVNNGTANLFLLVRSLSPEPASALANTERTYTLGSRTRTIANNANDRFQRLVVNSTYVMRNLSL